VDPGEFAEHLTEHLRNLLVTKVQGDAGGLDVSEPDRIRYEEQAARFSEEDVLRMISTSSDLEFALSRSPQPRLRLEVAVVKLIKMEPTVLLSDLLDQLSALEARLSTSGGDSERYSAKNIEETKTEGSASSSYSASKIEGAKAEGSAPSSYSASKIEGTKGTERANAPAVPPVEVRSIGAKAVPTLETITTMWPEIVNEAKRRKISLGSFLAEGRPIRVADGVLQLGFSSENGFHVDAITKNKKMVENILNERFSERLRIQCVVCEEHVGFGSTPPQVEEGPGVWTGSSVGAQKEGGKDFLDRLYEKEPIIRDIVETFNGELVGG